MRDKTASGSLRRLSGKVAIVTGGGKGIGKAICLRLATDGASVAVLAAADLASAKETARAVRSHGVSSEAFLVDACDRGSVDGMLDAVRRTLGPIDILVNNAGAGAHAPLEQLADDAWDRVFAVNVRGPFITATALVREAMQTGRAAVVVNIAGASAHRCYPSAGAYGPSKAALVSLTQQMAVEWSRYGIRVNGVSPGPIREAGTGWEEREPVLAEEVRRIPLGRAGQPIEVADAVAFLASDEARYINGHMLIVDGGSVATWYITA
ncbi:MAG: SDR family NAD(P)-dependent oxidoreductase [Janthinobacterium lividum]